MLIRSIKPSGSRDLYSAIEKALKGSPIAGLLPPLPPMVCTYSRSCSLRVIPLRTSFVGNYGASSVIASQLSSFGRSLHLISFRIVV
ncbi:hypothetical protein Bca4012_052827 [Brassica carinata]|uniref:Uncharacterized protein n=1 Tax=Brassica oleracea TaxID=3712 RepID=A0A3P6DY44_BRAOL|nr:unnamed protein product [Brassica oleracea]